MCWVEKLFCASCGADGDSAILVHPAEPVRTAVRGGVRENLRRVAGRHGADERGAVRETAHTRGILIRPLQVRTTFNVAFRLQDWSCEYCQSALIKRKARDNAATRSLCVSERRRRELCPRRCRCRARRGVARTTCGATRKSQSNSRCSRSCWGRRTCPGTRASASSPCSSTWVTTRPSAAAPATS